LERPETSGNAKERPILGTCAQNSEAVSEQHEAVRRLLADALAAFTQRRSMSEIRRRLVRALSLIEDAKST